MKFLIDHNADVNKKDRLGRTVLHHVVSRNYIDLAELLLDYCDPCISDNNGKTPLDCAKTHEMRYLIQSYIDICDIKEPE